MTRPTRLVEVTAHVWVATSRRYATTTTVLLDGQGGAVVVDPAWDPDELVAIPRDLAALGVECLMGVATHAHYDHVLWHPGLGEVPRWASATTTELLAMAREEQLAPLSEYLPDDLINIAGRLQSLAGTELPWSGPRATCVMHDAHAPGHLAVLVEDWGVLVCGDMLSDVELPMPADEDTTLDTYVAGLERLRAAVGKARLLVPGHGTVTDRPRDRFDADLRYLDDLLAGRGSDDPRVLDPDNATLHEANLARAAASSGRP